MMTIIQPSKGIHDAIGAIGRIKKEHNNIKLIICGGVEDKQYKKQLDELVNKLGLAKKVSFTGFIENPIEMYKMADAVLVCSRSEAWGRVAAESMLFEKPVIGFNAGGTREIIKHNVNGLLYSNIDELVSCMKTVVLNGEQIRNLVNNAKKYALENFSCEEYTNKVLKIISKVNNEN